MIRPVYSFLIRLHPSAFRERFGDEMMSIFDESARGRKAFGLLIDAFVSMLRQGILGPEHRRAMTLNLAWTIAALPLHLVVATFVNPHNRTMGAALFYAGSPVLFLWALYLLFRAHSPQSGFVCIKQAVDSLPATLERKRQSLRLWCDDMGRVLLLTMLAFVSIIGLGALLGKNLDARSWMSVNLIVFGIQSVLFFTVLRPFNERAALAVERQIRLAGGSQGQGA